MTVPPNREPYSEYEDPRAGSQPSARSQDGDRWRIEKRVSVGDILKTLIVAAGVILYVGEIEKATLRNSGQINTLATELDAERETRSIHDQALRERMNRNDRRIRSILEHIRQSLQRIEDRLDGKADKE